MNTIIISNLFEYFLLLSVKVSILAIGILLIKGALRQKLSARFHYYIWFLLILRLLIPFSVESPLSLMNLIPQYIQQVDNNYISDPNSSSIQTSNITKLNRNDTYSNNHRNSIFTSKELRFNLNTIALIWLIGIAGIMIYIMFVNILLLLNLKKYPLCDRKDIILILEECKSRLNVNFKVTVLYDEHFKSPMLCGFIHPKIIISPEIINRLSQEELKYVFLHELSHIKRRDLIINVIGMLIQTVYWFNPIIWYSIYKMKQDCEISCDATVLKVLSPEENKKYGLTIINMMKMISELKWVPGTIGFASKYNSRRIIMITLYKKVSVKWTVVALLTLTLLTGCSSLTSSTDQDAESSNASNTSKQDTTGLSTIEDNNSVNESKSDDKDNSFVKYLKFLGLSKEDLLSTLNEEPTTVDEGGLEFKEAGIRVWFDQINFTTVSQVFTQREDIDFNGAKIGDKIDEFKKVFGDPVSDKNGDMHFKYDENVYLSVNYDTTTNETFAVYLLSEDF